VLTTDVVDGPVNLNDKRSQQEGDYLLAVFVSAINAGKMGELGISLLIGGQWLSGQLVSARDWFEGLGAYLDRIPTAGELGEMVRASGAWAYPPEEEQDVPNADDGVAPHRAWPTGSAPGPRAGDGRRCVRRATGG
jgi:hypothetical protein